MPGVRHFLRLDNTAAISALSPDTGSCRSAETEIMPFGIREVRSTLTLNMGSNPLMEGNDIGILIRMVCSLFGVPQEAAMQVTAAGIEISGIQDSFETALNSFGDVLFAASAEYA